MWNYDKNNWVALFDGNYTNASALDIFKNIIGDHSASSWQFTREFRWHKIKATNTTSGATAIDCAQVVAVVVPGFESGVPAGGMAFSAFRDEINIGTAYMTNVLGSDKQNEMTRLLNDGTGWYMGFTTSTNALDSKSIKLDMLCSRAALGINLTASAGDSISLEYSMGTDVTDPSLLSFQATYTFVVPSNFSNNSIDMQFYLPVPWAYWYHTHNSSSDTNVQITNLPFRRDSSPVVLYSLGNIEGGSINSTEWSVSGLVLESDDVGYCTFGDYERVVDDMMMTDAKLKQMMSSAIAIIGYAMSNANRGSITNLSSQVDGIDDRVAALENGSGGGSSGGDTLYLRG